MMVGGWVVMACLSKQGICQRRRCGTAGPNADAPGLSLLGAPDAARFCKRIPGCKIRPPARPFFSLLGPGARRGDASPPRCRAGQDPVRAAGDQPIDRKRSAIAYSGAHERRPDTHSDAYSDTHPDTPQPAAPPAEGGQALGRLVPAHALLWHSEDTAPYECDGLTAYRQRPLLVCLPETSEQVQAVLALCHQL